MTDERWSRIVEQAGPLREDDGPWTRLSPAGLGAVVAYFAGPGHVRPVDGSASRPESDDRPFWKDEALSGSLVAEYLSSAGLPAAPYTEWQVRLSADRADELWEVVNDALESAESASELATSLSRDELAATARAVEQFFGRADTA